MKNLLFKCLISVSLFPSLVNAFDYPPNVDYGDKGDFHLKVAEEYGRSAIITTIGPALILLPEAPGSSSVGIPGGSWIAKDTAWDLNLLNSDIDSEKVRLVKTLSCETCVVGQPIHAHATVTKFDENGAAVYTRSVGAGPYTRFDPDAELEVDQVYHDRINLSIHSSRDPITYSHGYSPYFVRTYWSYNFAPDGVFAIRDTTSLFPEAKTEDFAFLGETQQYDYMGEPLVYWDHLSLTGVTGFPVFLGDLMVVMSDQQATGLAIYQTNLDEPPELLTVFNPTVNVPSGAIEKLGGYWAEPYGVNKIVWAARKNGNIPSREMSAMFVVDIENPLDPKLTCEIYFEQDESDPRDGDISSDPMYVNFQDEFAYLDHFKVNLELCEQVYADRVLSGDQGFLTTTQLISDIIAENGDNLGPLIYKFEDFANGCNGSQYFRPLGQIGVFGGYDSFLTPENNDQGMCFFVTDDEPDTSKPYVSGHRPLNMQTDVVLDSMISIHIPETLRSETVTGSIKVFSLTGEATERDEEPSVAYQLSHTGTLTAWMHNESGGHIKLKPDTQYWVEISGIQDYMGNTMDPYSFTFSTSGRIIESGVLIEPLIENIDYNVYNLDESLVQEGVTNALGQFQYSMNESIELYVGNVVFPRTSVNDTVSLRDIFSDDLNDKNLVNALRFLISIDSDSDFSNGIQIPDSVKSIVDSDIDFNLNVDEFEEQISLLEVLASFTESPRELVSLRDTLTLYTQTLIESGSLAMVDTDTDGVHDIIDFAPNNPNEFFDTDGDGIGDNADTDDDGDGVPDVEDLSPLNRLIGTEPISQPAPGETPFPTETSTPAVSPTPDVIPTAIPTPTPTPTPVATPLVPSYAGLAYYSLQSSQLACSESDSMSGEVWAANPDNDTVSIFNWRYSDPVNMDIELSLNREIRYSFYEAPTSITQLNSGYVVTYRDDDKVVFFDSQGGVLKAVDTGYGTQPVSSVTDGNFLYVALFGSGEVIKVDLNQVLGMQSLVLSDTIVDRLPVGPAPKAMALHDTRLLVTRFISTPEYGEVYDIETSTMSLSRIMRVNKLTVPDDIDHGSGVANFLSSIAINEDGTLAYITASKMNVEKGLVKNGAALDDDNTVRPMMAVLDLISNSDANVEPFTREGTFDFDNGADPTFVTFLKNGDIRARSMRGNNIVVITNESQNRAAQYRVGNAPTDMCATTRALFVKNFTDRSVSVIDVAGFMHNGSFAHKVNTEKSVHDENEILTDEELLGLQMFYRSLIPEMGPEGYMSCASCHAESGQDGMVWDVTQLGEGFRNTISLNGASGTRFGNLHWSRNFDEVQDFEVQLELLNGGDGLIEGMTFTMGDTPLTKVTTGLAPRMDALAAYVASLGKSKVRRSPYKTYDGQLTANADKGRQLFEMVPEEEGTFQGCTSCHEYDAGYRGLPGNEAHDVGTTSFTSGLRLGGDVLTEVRTPTLVELWATAPFYHDGSAPDLETVFEIGVHATEITEMGLDDQQLDYLIEYLRSIDREEYIDDEVVE